MARRALYLLLPIVSVLLLAGLAAVETAVSPWHGPVSQTAQSGSVPGLAGRDPLDSRPALKRGGFVMAAVESSRRKLRAPQRPTAEPLILTTRFRTEGLARSSSLSMARSAPALRPARPARPFAARGPPASHPA